MRTIAQRAGFLLASLVLAGVGTIAGAPAASAGSDETIVTARGSVGWYHNGDRVVACDAKKDGLSIEANYRHEGGTSTGRVLHVAGAGECDSETWNLYEGANIEIRMCYRDDFVITKCSGWQNAEA
jgi:hypothetical protein